MGTYLLLLKASNEQVSFQFEHSKSQNLVEWTGFRLLDALPNLRIELKDAHALEGKVHI